MRYKILLLCSFFLFFTTTVNAADPSWWEIQSIDTMKYSRDLARQEAKNVQFEKEIDSQISLIAQTGATHVAVGTPYDDEFVPYLSKWVASARRHGLSVWFRGNFSGWEGWFDYPRITEEEHTTKLQKFITNNSYLFEDGDIFTSCTECENGGPGDPRSTGRVNEFREFLINEYQISMRLFETMNKDVTAGMFSMNGDVAKLVMDRNTTQNLGGVVVLDHYVRDQDKLITDIEYIAKSSGGRVVLGELGAPIPDIHGAMSEKDQAEWLNGALSRLVQNINVVGVNYWVSHGGTTSLWRSSTEPKDAVSILKSYYEPEIIYGRVVDELGRPIAGALVEIESKQVISDNDGLFELSYHPAVGNRLLLSSDGFESDTYEVSIGGLYQYTLVKKDPTIFYNAYKQVYLFILRFL